MNLDFLDNVTQEQVEQTVEESKVERSVLCPPGVYLATLENLFLHVRPNDTSTAVIADYKVDVVNNETGEITTYTLRDFMWIRSSKAKGSKTTYTVKDKKTGKPKLKDGKPIERQLPDWAKVGVILKELGKTVQDLKKGSECLLEIYGNKETALNLNIEPKQIWIAVQIEEGEYDKNKVESVVETGDEERLEKKRKLIEKKPIIKTKQNTNNAQQKKADKKTVQDMI